MAFMDSHEAPARQQVLLKGLRRTSQDSTIAQAYYGSNPQSTRNALKALEAKGPIGSIAAALFRAQKASRRAKQYRGEYVGYAYSRKGEMLETLCTQLAPSKFSWGWGLDDNRSCSHVLYIDLPQGQVSFHSPTRFSGLDYCGEWDGDRASEERILQFCQHVLIEDTSKVSRSIEEAQLTALILSEYRAEARAAEKIDEAWAAHGAKLWITPVIERLRRYGEQKGVSNRRNAEWLATWLSTNALKGVNVAGRLRNSSDIGRAVSLIVREMFG